MSPSALAASRLPTLGERALHLSAECTRAMDVNYYRALVTAAMLMAAYGAV